MTSTIDATQPVSNSTVASSVLRANFAAAKADIEALQATSPKYQGTPSITYGAALGTGPNTTSVIAKDGYIHLNVTTGTSPTGTLANLCTVTFSTPYAVTPKIIITPQTPNSFANQSSSSTAIGASATTTTLTISGPVTALSASTTYVWNIQIIPLA